MSIAEGNYPGNFEEEILPHLVAAYNLARWLTRDDRDAEDVVQEACLRAFRFFGGFRGGNARAWLLKIVRNTFYTWFQRNGAQEPTTEFDENLFGPDLHASNPEKLVLEDDSRKLVRRALEELPRNFRKVLILRELEEMSYREISDVTGTPMGTVMSSLSRARDRLRQSLMNLADSDDLQDRLRSYLRAGNPRADGANRERHSSFGQTRQRKLVDLVTEVLATSARASAGSS